MKVCRISQKFGWILTTFYGCSLKASASDWYALCPAARLEGLKWIVKRKKKMPSLYPLLCGSPGVYFWTPELEKVDISNERLLFSLSLLWAANIADSVFDWFCSKHNFLYRSHLPAYIRRCPSELFSKDFRYGVGWFCYDNSCILYCQFGSLPSAGSAWGAHYRHQRP